MFKITQKKLIRNLVLLSTFAASLILSSTGMAAKGQRPEPPQQAFEACASKAEGDVCAFTGERGDAEGSCVIPPRGEETLVCAPQREQRRRDRNQGSETQ